MKHFKTNLLFTALLIAAPIFLSNPGVLQAAALPDLLPACAATGACRICDVIGIFITLGRWLIAGAAGLALLVIVWAGSTLVTSAGNAEKIGAAKKQIVGAVLGLGLVLAAFQLVSFIIFALTTPAAEQNFATSQNPSSETAGLVSLKTFLGIPWWTICDNKELLAKEGKAVFPSTANCAYWGDGTICDKGNTGAKKCCRGQCATGECITEKIIAPVVQGKPPLPGDGQIPTNGSVNLNDENSIRQYLTANDVTLQNDKMSCPLTASGANCINLVGLYQTALDTLIAATRQCGGCIVITGGTEPGHKSHGIDYPKTVDVDYSPAARAALEAVGVGNSGSFDVGYTCEACLNRSNGKCVSSGAVDCGRAEWMHLEL